MVHSSNLRNGILNTLVCLLLVGCQVKGMELVDPDPKDITRRDLFLALGEQGKLLVVYGLENEQFVQSLKTSVQSIRFRNRPLEVEVKSSAEVTEIELSTLPVVLVGSPVINKWITALSPQLPFEFRPESFTVGPELFSSQEHTLLLNFYPNPLNPRLPLSIYSSQDESNLQLFLENRMRNIFWSGWNYEVLKGTRRVLLGNFNSDPENRWDYHSDGEIHLPQTISHQWSEGPYEYYSYHEQIDQSSINAYGAGCALAAQKIAEFVGVELDDGAIKQYLYPSTELKGLMVGNTQQSHVQVTSNEVHTVLNPDFSARQKGLENTLILRKLIGEPATDLWEQGLAVYFTETWGKQGFAYWSKRLIDSNNGLTVDQLLDDQAGLYSKLKREALAASLVSYLIEEHGQEHFLSLYKHWSPGKEEAETLTKAWWQWVKKGSEEVMNVGWQSQNTPFLKGVNFTHEGYRIFNGYGSKQSAQSLQRLSEIQANAVAIVPYSGMRDPQQVQPLRFSNGPGGENDEGVIHTIKRAQSLGMSTMLKPQVWISGSWPGDVKMPDDEQWDLFFEYYYQWISHYVLMAEMYEVDFMCIGVEFSQATLLQPERWRALIKRLRGLYSGKLIYAANWGEEFETISFWDELDYIGLNCYYPLARSQKPNSDLTKNVTKVFDLVRAVSKKHRKPVILTEIGFRSVQAPWVQPHEQAGDKPFNEEHQALAYREVMQQLSNYPEIAGILWWKWPTNLGNGNEDRRFVPSGKMAEQVMEEYFKVEQKR